MSPKSHENKDRGLIITIQLEPDFFRTYRFREVVDNVELIIYMTFQNILMTGYKDMGKKQKWYFSSNFDPSRVFFQNSGSLTFVP